MSQLNNGANFTGTITLSKPSDTVLTLSTSDNYIDKNIVLSLEAPTVVPSFTGGSLVSKSAEASFSNATVSSTDISGVLIQTLGTAGRASITYGSSVNGWVSISQNSEAFPAMSSVSWSGSNYYLNGVTIGVNKAFDVAVPISGSTETCHFSVTSSGVDVTGFPVATVSETRSFLGMESGYRGSIELSAGDSFDITVPNGTSSAVTYHYAVDANGSVSVS